MRESKAIVQLVDLSIGYPGLRLFENLNLDIPAGQLICFMGPNGIGKSTLIRTIAGLEASLAGSIIFHSNTLLKEQLIALVLTDPIRAPYMSVFELVLFGRYPYLDWHLNVSDHDRDLVERSLKQVHLDHLRDRRINELSDGQKQMAMIARALAQDTPVMILDEPTAHLDLNNRVEIMKLLKDLSRTMNKAILLATHELDLALQTADKIWLSGTHRDMITGIPEELVLSGAFDEVFRFKGFDLRTGKVQHLIFRNTKIALNGSGHAYWWTKNLLERNGFAVTSDGSPSVRIIDKIEKVEWVVNEKETFESLSDLLHYISSLP